MWNGDMFIVIPNVPVLLSNHGGLGGAGGTPAMLCISQLSKAIVD